MLTVIACLWALLSMLLIAGSVIRYYVIRARNTQVVLLPIGVRYAVQAGAVTDNE